MTSALLNIVGQEASFLSRAPTNAVTGSPCCETSAKSLAKIEVILATGAAWQWQADLIRRLRSDGYPLSVVARETGARSWHTGLSLLMALERFAYGFAAIHPAVAMSQTATRSLVAADFAGPADFVIDLTGSDAAEGHCLRLLYDGSPSYEAAVAAILDGHAPTLTVVCNGRSLAQGLPAHSDVVTRGLAWTFARAASLIRHVVVDLRGNLCLDTTPSSVRDDVAMRSPWIYGAEILALKLARQLTHLAKSPEMWRVAWRFMDEDGPVTSSLRWPAGGYIPLRDDGKRFYADPFPFEHDGVCYVFCEEFPYATGKGLISVFTLSPDGFVSPTRVVIEAPYHLSYPRVFRHRDAIYMMPESGEAKTIEIWRAERFPDKWVKHAELLNGFGAYDATLTKKDGRYWLFASLLDDGGSSWDALGLFHAEDLFGPWRAHPLNPVLVDASSARPGGIMLEREGKIRRVAQNCVKQYGGGLTICDVERLDLGGYRQTIAARLQPPPRSNATGAHTLNNAGRIEVIDLYGPRGEF